MHTINNKCRQMLMYQTKYLYLNVKTKLEFLDDYDVLLHMYDFII